MMQRRLLGAAALGLLASPSLIARAQTSRPETGLPRPGRTWIGTWAASPMGPRPGMPSSFANVTIRQVVRVSLGGSRVRVRLTNEYGTRPVVVGAAHLALSAGGARTAPGSDRPLAFAGRREVVLLPGAPALSDPVDLEVPDRGDLALSLYLPGAMDLQTVHAAGLQNAHVSQGRNVAADADPAVDVRYAHRFFFSEVAVEAEAGPRAILCFGDSITDGTNSTVDTNGRYPDLLARRLHEAGQRVAVLNQGLAGNRVLSDGAGQSALARFERDVLAQAGVTHVISLIGINDFGWPGTALEPTGVLPSAEAVIAGYGQMIARAHARGIRIVGCTLTPFEGAFAGQPNQGYFNPDKEARRRAVNEWVRGNGAFDGVIDFEAALRDPAKPGAILAAYDSGDRLHPNDAGYRAMAEAVNLALLAQPGAARR